MSLLRESTGPFHADQVRPGDRYELSNGHAIYCMTTGARGSRAILMGASVLDSDPAVEEVGVNTGYTSSQGMLRAPDVVGSRELRCWRWSTPTPARTRPS
jgi:hypothetical protein